MKKAYIAKQAKDFFAYLNSADKREGEEWDKVGKEFDLYAKNIIPVIWEEVMPLLIANAKYFTVTLDFKTGIIFNKDESYKTLDKDSLQFVDQVAVASQIDERYVKGVNLEITPELITYISETHFDDWQVPHPENLSLFDESDEPLFESVTHENYVTLYLTEDEAKELNERFQLNLVEEH